MIQTRHNLAEKSSKEQRASTAGEKRNQAVPRIFTEADSAAGEDLLRILNANRKLFAIFSTDVDGQILTWNHGAKFLFKYSADEVIGRSCDMLIGGDVWNEFKSSLQISTQLQNGGTVKEFAYTLRGGEQIVSHTAVSSALIDGDLRLTFVSVTEGSSEDEFSPEELGELLFQTNEHCAKILDLEGKIQCMNPAGLCLMSVEDFSKLSGKVWSDVWPVASRETAHRAVSKALQGEKSTFEAVCPTLKGELMLWRVTVEPIYGKSGMMSRLLSVSECLKAVTDLPA